MQFVHMPFAQKKRVSLEKLVVTQNHISCFKFCDKIRIYILPDVFNSVTDKTVSLTWPPFHLGNYRTI